MWIIDDMRDGTPVGMVRASLYLPDGYIKANGATVLRADYPRLVNLADKYNLWTEDTTNYPGLFGVGDGLTTFTVPDYRGYFDRYLDDNTDRVLGSKQDDDNKEHSHTGTTNNAGWHNHALYTQLDRASGDGNAIYGDESWYGEIYKYTEGAGEHNHIFTTDVSGGAESRPKNIARLAVIKY